MSDWRLPATTAIGRVRLRVGDLDRALAFYEGVLGMVRVASDEGDAALAAPSSDTPVVVLDEVPGAPPQPRGTTGLYHFAILQPDRGALADLLIRLHARRWPMQGASDHGVSEALYLADADGNGIELYADRPGEVWPRRGDELAMTTLPLDIAGLLRVAEHPEAGADMAPGARMGHIHLHVSNLTAAEAFYVDLLGFDVVTRRYPGALFMSAGSYHHHVAVNVWAGVGAPRPPENSAGLVDFAIVIDDMSALTALVERLREAGLVPEFVGDGRPAWRVTDPDGIGVRIERARSAR